MRTEELDNELIIYINLGFLKDYEFDNEKKSLELLPKLLLKIKKIYHLNFAGLYKIKAYQNKKIGIIMEIIKIDDLSLSDYTDFRIRIYNDYDFLLEFDDYYDFLKGYETFLFNNKYYANLKTVEVNDVLRFSDYYNIIYKDVDSIMEESLSIS